MITFFQHLSRSLLPGVLVALIISGLLIRLLMGQSLTNEFDQGLISRAQALMAITEQDEDGVELEVYPEALNRYFLDINPDYFEIRNQSGLRLFFSESLDMDDSLEVEASAVDGIVDARLPDGRPGRLIRQTYFPKIDIDDDEDLARSEAQKTRKVERQAFSASGTPTEVNGIVITPDEVTVTVATSRESLNDTLTQLNLILLLTAVLTTAVVVLLQRHALRRAVRPLQEMSDQISQLNVARIDQTLSLSYPIQELDVLKTRFNSMLKRLNEGFQRERRFSSDLAHEMRTPLSELRTLTEVMQRWPEDPNLKASFNEDLLISVGRMERLIQSLLALSRGELGLTNREESVDLCKLVPQMVDLHTADFEQRKLSVKMIMPKIPTLVIGNDTWPLILENLISNAATYSAPSSTVDITLSHDEESGEMMLSMTNDAPDLEQDDLPKLFDRLWRKDQSRTSGYHSGLGLSLVKMYSASVAVTVAAELYPAGRLKLSLTGRCVRQNEPHLQTLG